MDQSSHEIILSAYALLAREMRAQALEINALIAHWNGVKADDPSAEDDDSLLLKSGAAAIDRLVEALRNGERAPILLNRHFKELITQAKPWAPTRKDITRAFSEN